MYVPESCELNREVSVTLPTGFLRACAALAARPTSTCALERSSGSFLPGMILLP